MKLLNVYGFTRSGSHYLMSLLALNFYPDADLATGAGGVGHWADRAQVAGSEHGLLSGGHGPPQWGYDASDSVYVFRDGRAVAASLYRSQHFINPMWKGRPFSEFIRSPLDWAWTTGNRAYTGQTIIEQWHAHLTLWRDTAAYKVRYEDAVKDPEYVLDMIGARFGMPMSNGYEFKIPAKLMGFFPSGGTLDGWRELWNNDDLDYFASIVPRGFYGVVDD